MLSTFDDAMDDRIRAGHACDQIYRRHWGRLVQEARARGCDEHESLDVVQDLFLRLFRRGMLLPLHSRPTQVQTAVLSRTLRWVILNRWRRRTSARRGQGQATVSLDTLLEEGHELASPSGDPATELDRAWAHGVLENSLEHLRASMSSSQWRSLEPALLQDQSSSPPPTAASTANRVALHRARHRLRQLLADAVGSDIRTAHNALLNALVLPG